MNWEDYKKLTVKQKEEYNFRFAEKEHFNIWGLSLIIMNLFLIAILFIFITYIIITNPDMAQYKSDVVSMMVSANSLVLVAAVFVLGYIIDFLFRVIYHWYHYSKWKKENKIVITTWWSKWRK